MLRGMACAGYGIRWKSMARVFWRRTRVSLLVVPVGVLTRREGKGQRC